MKKILLTILTVLITVIMIIAMKSGIKIGSLHILGFQGIANENQNLVNAIDQANEKTNDYNDKLQSIEKDSEKLAEAKKAYFDLVQVSTESEIQEAMQIKSYKVEYLWSKIGNYATKEGVKVKMEIAQSSLGDSEYKDLNFTVDGNYYAIAFFITDLENDSSLDFTIDYFDMTSGHATFTVKDVKIIEEKTTAADEATTPANTVNNTNKNTNTNTATNTVTLNQTEEEKAKTSERANEIVNAFNR